VQKLESVDRRFEQVAEDKKKLDEERAAFAAEQAEKAKKLEQKKDAEQATLDAETLKATLKAIREGEGDEGVEELKKLLEATNKQTKAPEVDVDSLITERLERERKAREEQEQKAQEEALTKAIQDAERKFESDFSTEIGENKEASDFYDLAIVKYQKLAKDPAWNTKSYDEQFTQAGNLAKEQLGLGESTSTGDVTDDKTKLKEQITETKAASTKSEGRTDEEKIKSRGDIVMDMKRARHQV
jgi:hypothetical protein